MQQLIPAQRIEGLINDRRGLDDAEIESRRARYGRNDILEAGPSGWDRVLRDTLRDPMVWFLAGTAVLFAAMKDYTEAIVLTLALVPIAAMDAYLHRRTQATTEGLAGRLAPRARVLRNDSWQDVAAADLVPGDLVRIGTGETFPADGLIVGGDEMQVDESTLTGESLPVRKRPFAARPAMPAEFPVEDAHWGAAGTRLLTGEAMVRLVFTGPETIYGQIVRSARLGQGERTPLQMAISALVTVLIATAVVICIALAATRYYQGHGAVDAIVSAITLAVAALPEEFPVVFTFFLGVGVFRLARKQALVRRAVVVENIGRVTCICSDKTGTLTEGRLQLAHRIAADAIDPERLVDVAALASRAESADPLDLALLHGRTLPGDERIATFPFTEDRRRETTILRTPAAALWAAAKGAPETISAMVALDDAERQSWRQRTRDLAATGHKVIAVASRPLEAWSGGEPDRGFQFAGLLAFEDPVRDGVAEAVAKAQGAGIRVIMVTGDHPATAAAIAAEIGIGRETPRVITGDELTGLIERNGADGLRDFDVIARAIPSQKLDLVRALQRDGEIVAVTGDGINDVPALQGADIGIAMGERGTRTAREVASIVLLDDNFRTIVRAIAEGRQLFQNLKLSFAYLLMVHMPLVVTAALIPFAGFPLLYLPVHVVWLELIIHPTALLVFQHMPESRSIGLVRRGATRRVFDLREWAIIAAVGALMTLLVTLGYARSLGTTVAVEHARTMALAALILGSVVVTVVMGGLRDRIGILFTAGTVITAVLLVQVPQAAALLHLKPLHLDDWLIAVSGAVAAGALAFFIPQRKAE